MSSSTVNSSSVNNSTRDKKVAVKKVVLNTIKEYDEKSNFSGMNYICDKKSKIKFVLDKDTNVAFGKEVENKLVKLDENEIEMAKKLSIKVLEDPKATPIIYNLLLFVMCFNRIFKYITLSFNLL